MDSSNEKLKMIDENENEHLDTYQRRENIQVQAVFLARYSPDWRYLDTFRRRIVGVKNRGPRFRRLRRLE